MKTIFISILSGVEAKNILRTNILSGLLADPNIRIVLFLKSRERVAFYEKEFRHERLLYEVVSDWHFSHLNNIFEFLKHYLVRTSTLNLYKRLKREKSGNLLAYIGSHVFNLILANHPCRVLARFLDQRFARDNMFAPFFETYHPDLVFLANLFEESEISFLREAREQGVKVIGFINSWDKITSKGFVRLLPDALIVPNEIVKAEAVRLADCAPSNIFVSGIPQYDTYADTVGLLPRDEFFKKIHADARKPLIVFGPMGRALSNSDWLAIDMTTEILANDFGGQAELLVRFQPNDFSADEAELKKRPTLRADVPGVRFSASRGTDWDMTRDDLLHLKNTLHHCSILVAYASSISIDAVCFGKPVINIGFEMREGEPALKQPSRRYVTEHYTKALATGGIRLVKSRQKLVEWIRIYLAEPSRDKAGRERLVSEQCYKFDGKAGERIVGYVLQQLSEKISNT